MRELDYGFKKEIVSETEFVRRLMLGILPVITTKNYRIIK